MRTICAESVSKRKLPVNLKADHLNVFEHDLQRTIPETQLLSFENIRVSAEGLLFSGATILPESFAFPHHLEEWKFRSVVKLLAQNYLVCRRQKLDGPVFWITDYWSKAYFHWMTDALTRLVAVRDRLNEHTLLLPAEYDKLEFVKFTLQAFSVKSVKFMQPNETLLCRNLLMPNHTAPSGHYNEALIREVRETLLSAYGSHSTEEGKRIYISRGRAAKRRIVNEDEIIPILRKFDFQIVFAEELPFIQQVETFSRARVIVSNHGAGLTNMLFMRKAGSVLELRHDKDRIRNWFFNLSSALDLNYLYQLCPSTREDTHTGDLFVSPSELEETLHLLIGPYS